MQYISTRGQSPAASFEDAVLTGLAPDGGLYIPAHVPTVSAAQLTAWAKLSYQDLAFEVIKPFVGGAIPDAELKAMIDASYAEFSDPKIAPLQHLYDEHYVLELYCGPTLAFKDFALQLLGRLLDYFLSRRQQHLAILGATSGDTGSAALEGCKHSAYL
ncbi:MAG: threonine synthase, partial [Pseudomonadales bacterium]|nr:threonine synthase [Pseudomonadales bacterium]